MEGLSPDSQSPLNVHLEHYDGPLDLLLDLIRKQQIDIRDIPIARITSQYLAFLEKARELDLDLGARREELHGVADLVRRVLGGDRVKMTIGTHPKVFEVGVRRPLLGVERREVRRDRGDVAAGDRAGERGRRAHRRDRVEGRAHEGQERVERHVGRRGEALDLLLALTTGHEGSMCTVHAASARGALRRLATLALLADASVPAAAVDELLASAIDMVVVVERAAGGRRVVRDIVAASTLIAA